MSTRALVGLAANSDFTYTYLHSDGYPEWTGRVLLQHHNSADAACKLVHAGDLDGLGSTGDYTIYADSEPAGEAGLAELHECAAGMDAEWIYLWRDGRWQVAACQHAAERRVDYQPTHQPYTPLDALQDRLNGLPGAATAEPCPTPTEMYHPRFR